MNYKVGDKVRIKTWEEMEKEFGEVGIRGSESINIPLYFFTKDMEMDMDIDFPDRTVKIKEVIDSYYLIEDRDYCFIDDMIKEKILLYSTEWKDYVDQQEWLKLQVELHIDQLMQEKGISKEELAKRLKRNVKYVNKILDGANLTLHEIATIFLALNASLVIDTKEVGFHTTIKKRK